MCGEGDASWEVCGWFGYWEVGVCVMRVVCYSEGVGGLGIERYVGVCDEGSVL